MKLLYKLNLITCFFLLLNHTNVFAQGCVAIRSTGGVCTMDEHPDSSIKHGAWLFNSNSRYYKSFRHFVGKQEQFQRTELQNNVINKVFTQDFGFTRIFNDRWSVAIDIPFADNSRSQVSKGGTRFSTHSFGLGDIRVTGYYWLLNPAKVHDGNIQVGLGAKFATGAYNLQDYFLQADGTKALGPLDQSIQLGDGGTGVSAEVNAYYNLSHKFGFYGNFFYLANPRDVNGTPRSATPASPTTIAATGDIQSVPDQMLIRVGASLAVNHFDFSAGFRDDCLPVRDLFGQSDGFRRPGYILSVEPGVTYRVKNIAIYAFVPIAIIRDRTQSVPDIRTTEITGVYTHGDAAFADYVVNIGLTIKF
ncbi:hypothetical protein ACPPVU_13835 [Mucilaginibacter sp. McL0603]|uniref:hypothetical protein n=1 Tax=Mucilaginibacter sp. McL0603 TaxID=3415670 RepID=UPI003CF08E80